MNTNASTHRSPLKFFLLVFALTTPFWALSGIVKAEGLPDNLPVTDVGATFVPLLAALIVIFLWGPKTLAHYRFSTHVHG